jgi:hypothetical protein
MRTAGLPGLYLVLGSQTPGAHIELFRFTIDHDCGRMDIRIKPAVGVLLGMADILTEHWTFAANIALQNRNSFDLLNRLL